MGGVFMKKIGFVYILFAVFSLGIADLAMDLWTLESGVIRLHVVGASNDGADQERKLKVRDAVLTYLQPMLDEAQDRQEALSLLEEQRDQIDEVAERTLRELGCEDAVTVSLGRENFPRRDYDTFSLPAGVYESLRIRIGEAEGRNWWCVVFPSFCMNAAGEEIRAAGAGFDEGLSDTILREEGYEIRFFFLDWLGQMQNFFQRQ